jgi:hypothetical protein
VIEHPEDFSAADMRVRDNEEKWTNLFEIIAMISERQSRIEVLVEKIALGMGISPHG